MDATGQKLRQAGLERPRFVRPRPGRVRTGVALCAAALGAALCAGCNTAQGIVDDIGVGVEGVGAAADTWAGKPEIVY